MVALAAWWCSEKYSTVAAAAKHSGLSERHIERLLHEGTIPGNKLGRDWQVRLSAVMAYRREGRRPGRKPKPK